MWHVCGCRLLRRRLGRAGAGTSSASCTRKCWQTKERETQLWQRQLFDCVELTVHRLWCLVVSLLMDGRHNELITDWLTPVAVYVCCHSRPVDVASLANVSNVDVFITRKQHRALLWCLSQGRLSPRSDGASPPPFPSSLTAFPQIPLPLPSS